MEDIMVGFIGLENEPLTEEEVAELEETIPESWLDQFKGLSDISPNAFCYTYSWVY